MLVVRSSTVAMATECRRLVGIIVACMMASLSAYGRGDQPTNPRIVEHPEDQFVAKNEPATLNCKAEGEPPPMITWYRNGVPVVTANENPSSHRMLLPSGQLFFLRIIHNKNSRPDVGVYYCNATNPETRVSAISKNATLEIASLGTDFREHPHSIELPVGAEAMLDCRPPKGDPEPRVRWRKDNDPVKPSDRLTIMETGSLRIKEIRREDSGTYVCIAYNIGGEKDSNPARLLVREKPKISEGPKDVIVQENLDAVFHCWATGDPEPIIIWKKVDGQMPQGRVTILDDRSLKIERVRQSDDGVYVCHAENSVGSIEAEARLTVHSQPSFVVTPRDKTVGSGRRVVMRCQVTGNPPPAVFWNREFSQTLMFPKQDYDRMSVTEEGSLVIDPVRRDDAGEYVCKALSVAGSAYAKAKLDVRDVDARPPPIIYHGPQNQTLPVNSVAIMPCSASGEPIPLIGWYRNNKPIAVRDPRFVLLDSGTLQITDLRKTDSGLFTCKAISETGESEWNAYLIVDTPSNPSIVFHRTPEPSAFPGTPSRPTATEVSETSVRLAWKANANNGASPVFAFTVEYFSHETGEGWIVATDTVSDESYIVQGLQPNTSYLFLIRARNAHGLSLPSHVTQMIRTKPLSDSSSRPPLPSYDLAVVAEKLTSAQIVAIQQTKAISSTSVRITWEVRRHNRYIEGFIVKYRPWVALTTTPTAVKPGGDVTASQTDGASGSAARQQQQQQAGGATNGVGDAESYAEERIFDGLSTSVLIQSLKKYTTYEIIVQPFYKSVFGLESLPARIKTLEDVPSAPPQNIRATMVDNTTMYLSWEPPPRDHINGPLVGYKIHIVAGDSRFNRQIPLNSSLEAIYVHHMQRDTEYKIQMAAVSRKGAGAFSDLILIGNGDEGETRQFVREAWFVATLIGAVGTLVWVALCVISILLYRRCRACKLAQKNAAAAAARITLYSPDDHTRNTNVLSFLDTESYIQKDGNGYSNESNAYRPSSNGSRSTDVYSNDISNIIGPSRPGGFPYTPQQQHHQQQQQQQPSVYDNFRSLQLSDAVSTPSATTMPSYPPDCSVFRPIRNGPCSSSQDESWSRYGDDTLSYDDDDDVHGSVVDGPGNYGQFHKQPVLYLPPPPYDPPPVSHALASSAEVRQSFKSSATESRVGRRHGESVGSRRNGGGSFSKDTSSPGKVRHGHIRTSVRQSSTPAYRTDDRRRDIRSDIDDDDSLEESGIHRNHAPVILAQQYQQQRVGRSRPSSDATYQPSSTSATSIEGNDYIGVGPVGDNGIFSSLLIPSSEWSRDTSASASATAKDDARRRIYSPHAMSEPTTTMSDCRRLTSMNDRGPSEDDDGCVSGGSRERLRYFSDNEESQIKIHQGSGSAVLPAMMHQFCPPSPAPQDPDESDNDPAVFLRPEPTVGQRHLRVDDVILAPESKRDLRDELHHISGDLNEPFNDPRLDRGAVLGDGETNIDSDTNCSSMLSSIVSSDALSCFTDGDITKATSVPLNSNTRIA